MNYLKDLKEQFTFDQLLLIFTCFSFTFPFYILGPILLIEFIYLLVSKKAIIALKQTPQIKFLYLFVLISLSISIIHKNILGALATLGIFIVIILMVYYRKHINQSTFEFIIDMLIVLSILWAIYGIYEQFQIYHRLGVDHFTFKVYARRENRLNSVFYNANYYAMMIEFIVLICVYKMMQVKTLRRIVFYVVTIVCNLFALYLSGSRTAWIPFVVTIPFMFLINKRFIYFTTPMAGIGGAGLLLLLEPKLMQRATIFQDFAKRSNIWETAIKGIQAHPLLGEGPLTYFHIYKQYHGHPTQHAHSIYLDPILSHGIIGVILAGIYFAGNLKEVYLLLKRRIDLRLFSLISAFILTILIHGILDYTVYWVQTGLLFLIVLSASSMYFHKEQPYDIQEEH